MIRNWFLAAALASSAMLAAVSAYADEGGISLRLPGQYGSFAATPAQPGWSWATVYYHASLAAGADQQFPRGGQINAGLDANANLVLFGPAYTFEEPGHWSCRCRLSSFQGTERRNTGSTNVSRRSRCPRTST